MTGYSVNFIFTFTFQTSTYEWQKQSLYIPKVSKRALHVSILTVHCSRVHYSQTYFQFPGSAFRKIWQLRLSLRQENNPRLLQCGPSLSWLRVGRFSCCGKPIHNALRSAVWETHRRIFPFHDVHGSVHPNINLIERTNKMQPCSRIYYSFVSQLFNMFRATHPPSSRAQKL